MSCVATRSENAARRLLELLRLIGAWVDTMNLDRKLSDEGLCFRDAHNQRGLLVALDTLCAIGLAERRPMPTGKGRGYQWRAK